MKSPPASRRDRFLALQELPVATTLGRFRAEILYWGFFDPKWWRNYLHTHSFFEICYAYAGEGTFQINGANHAVRAGDVFVAKPTEPHAIVSSRKHPLGIYFWAYTLVPTAGRTARLQATDGIDALLDAFGASATWVSRAPRSMPQMLELLAEEASARRAGYSVAIDALLGKLLLDTARAVVPRDVPAEIVNPSSTDPAQGIVRTAIQYLRDNFSRPIAMRDVGAQVHVSERHLSRLFLATTGKSVIDHLIEIRVSAARQLLLDRNRPIKSIAADVGYPDVRYFITLFHKHVGTTPARWRISGGTKFLRQTKDKQRQINADQSAIECYLRSSASICDFTIQLPPRTTTARD